MKKWICLILIFLGVHFIVYADDDLPLYSPQKQTISNKFKDMSGFKFGASLTLKYNIITMETSNNNSLLFHQMQIDEDVFIGYNFNGYIALYLKSSFQNDLVSTNSGLRKIDNRFGIYGKIGPRFYLTRWCSIEPDFVFGANMYRSNWNYYNVIGADLLINFDVLRTKNITMSLSPTFMYRRTSYSNEYSLGVMYTIEA